MLSLDLLQGTAVAKAHQPYKRVPKISESGFMEGFIRKNTKIIPGVHPKHILVGASGLWRLDSEVWLLGFRISSLGYGAWNLESGLWGPESGVWSLGLGS